MSERSDTINLTKVTSAGADLLDEFIRAAQEAKETPEVSQVLGLKEYLALPLPLCYIERMEREGWDGFFDSPPPEEETEESEKNNNKMETDSKE